ncbi:MAG: DnaA/Hda family protein [Pirellulales bacterium]
MDRVHSIALDFPQLRKSMGSIAETPSGVVPSFLIGPENRELLDLIRVESIVHLASASPIFLYGPTGVGKTAVALTLAGRWAMAVDSRGITLTTGADFGRQFAHACEADDMDRFRQRHRGCRLLVIDSIHELVNKVGAQEELVHTLDELRERGTPVVATAPKLPGSIRGLKAALTSRLMSGLTLQLHMPGVETRREILVALSRSMGEMLSEEELDRLVENLPSSTSALQLRGVLIQWLHHQRFAHDSREQSLQVVIENQQKARVPAIQDIAKAVAKQLGVRLSDLKGATRKANVVRARGLAMYLARQWTSLSLQQIGEHFGNRDHTTVLHACRKTEGDLVTDVELLRVSEEIKQSVGFA